ncbi:BON domain-containing protein [Arenimonas terrae]|uniref:BON domain-containing protein n=1 Tax=Arenimonas terrae TaxID=2546226 RepID=A0A5C4RNZ6_9GAMM|nr:BON domain-containing protein [Arenimonas terrae]TNJ32675.1 BON domain-containing protein [Arenimonas terrae]
MNAMKTSLLATALCLGLGASPVFAEDTAAPERTAAQAIDDAAITASIKTKLLADERTKGFDINVDTMKGVVTLRGGADSQAAKQAAQEVAGQAEGVVLIKNELVVAPDDSEARQDADTATASGEVREKLDEAGDGIDDAWITSKVKTQLLADAAVKGTQIDVDTKANVVTLTGTAESQAAKDAAIRIAAGTNGVQKVVADQLLVKQ